MLSALIGPVYAAKKPVKDDRVIYTVRYWDRAMAPDQKKEWHFFAENESEISDKSKKIIVQLNSRVEEVKTLMNTVRHIEDMYLPIDDICSEINNLLTSHPSKKVIWLVLDGLDGLLGHNVVGFLKYTLDDEKKAISKDLMTCSGITEDLREDGSVGDWRGKILDWGEYESYAGFKSKISTLSQEKQEECYNNLIWLNMYNLLGCKIDFEKSFESFYQPKFSKDNLETKITVLSGPSNKNKDKKSYKIKKTFHRDSTIEVK
ncbi:MAG: hypothetical protein BGO07_00675 [Alphaproteobacteria bacterium 40-19]|nr:MAG: hypothetical protein BGO07_00675 [Alphaproteobacteria bacterium 40-19]